jgi:hypothetical protein
MGMQNCVTNRAFHGVQNLSPKFVYATKRIQCFEDLWNEEENAWQTTNHLKRITRLRNIAEKKVGLIGSVPWNLSRPNSPLKPLAKQWKVLALPQADFQTQEFYHVHNERNGKMMAIVTTLTLGS